MFTQDRGRMRRYFIDAWHKARTGAALEPLERQIVEVIREHPEHHALLEDHESAVEREFLPDAGEGNPFLHLALHIAILEQVGTDRPAGIRTVYQRLAGAMGDAHEAEHRIMECLAQGVWEAQRTGQPPDEGAYLECLDRLVGLGSRR